MPFFQVTSQEGLSYYYMGECLFATIMLKIIFQVHVTSQEGMWDDQYNTSNDICSIIDDYY